MGSFRMVIADWTMVMGVATYPASKTAKHDFCQMSGSEPTVAVGRTH